MASRTTKPASMKNVTRSVSLVLTGRGGQALIFRGVLYATDAVKTDRLSAFTRGGTLFVLLRGPDGMVGVERYMIGEPRRTGEAMLLEPWERRQVLGPKGLKQPAATIVKKMEPHLA